MRTFPCSDCGATVTVHLPGCDIGCDRCGALHNGFGQRLRDDAPVFGPNGVGDTYGWED